MARRMMEGSQAVAGAVALCRPQVISAYPITPQTHIVQELGQMVADGELKAEFVNVESEHSAASVVLGASATGVRVYTASSSQGIMLMAEVLFNIAGMRLPVVLTCVNRALSAPLNIWNDQQDSISVRDSGVLQLYAENNQEAADLIYQAYRIAEDHRIMLPVMVCMDGYILSHAWEGVDIPDQETVDGFLPPYEPIYKLDPDSPLSFGMYMEPDKYTETRYMIQRTMERAIGVIQEVAHDFERAFGRPSVGIMEEYQTEDASTVLVAMGSVASTIKDVVDELRGRGERVGVLRLVSYRPFPNDLLYGALGQTQDIIVIEKALSLGGPAPLASDLRSAFYGRPTQPHISSFVGGLGGRDITGDTIRAALERARTGVVDGEFLDLRADLELEGV
ncbi:MAG: pyruvate ferredoxin oxidoreductase [Dehalococcoidia bacterium]